MDGQSIASHFDAQDRQRRIEQRALELWREREMTLPKRLQRIHPDALDRATGAWALVLALAADELNFTERR